MLGPPTAVAGGAVKGSGGSGVFSCKDSAAVGEEFMALVAGLLAGLVPGTQPQAQNPIAPGPNDGKVPTETGADSTGLALPQGLAEQAAAAAGVAVTVHTVDPKAVGPRSPEGMIQAHSEHGPRLDAAWTQNHGASRAPAMDGAGDENHGKHSAAAVSFTIMPIGTPQVVSTAAPVSVPTTTTAATTAAVAAPTEGEATTAPLPAVAASPIADTSEAGTAPEGDGQKQDAPKTPVFAAPTQAPAAAKDAAAPATTAPAGTAEKSEKADDAPAPVQATPTAPTERPKDVGHTRVLPAHSPTQLAHELVDHLRVAVREEGREITINLRPAELGSMTIRVTMQDGVLQAHIAADRPESARLLEQSLSNLQDMLADRGYEMGSLDVNTGGPDARETGASAQNTPDHDQGRGQGHNHHNHGELVGAGSAPQAVVMHDGDVNVLA